MKNTGKAYESLAEDVYRHLCQQQRVRTLELKPNPHEGRYPGAGTSHQIDLLWRFEAADGVHVWLIDAKDHKTAVKKLSVLALRATLLDVQETTTEKVEGIVVTRVGFQEGARDYARHVGIHLHTLRRQIVIGGKLRFNQALDRWEEESLDATGLILRDVLADVALVDHLESTTWAFGGPTKILRLGVRPPPGE